MKKFLVLYNAKGATFEKMMKNATPEMRDASMQGWMKWMGDNKDSIVDPGAPVGKTKRIDAKGTTDVKNAVGGYSVIQAATHAQAAKLFKKSHPHLQMPGTWVELVEIMPMPGG